MNEKIKMEYSFFSLKIKYIYYKNYEIVKCDFFDII